MGKKPVIQVVLLTLRMALAAIFGTAGLAKIWDFAGGQSATPDFALAIQNYEILSSPDLRLLLAFYLPWLEVATALALLTKRLYLGGLAAASALTLTFLGALGSAWWRGLDISCGCFGKEVNATHFGGFALRDLGMLAVIGALAFIEWRGVLTAERRDPAGP